MAGIEASTAGTFWRLSMGTGQSQYSYDAHLEGKDLLMAGEARAMAAKATTAAMVNFILKVRVEEVKDVVVMSAGDEQRISD